MPSDEEYLATLEDSSKGTPENSSTPTDQATQSTDMFEFSDGSKSHSFPASSEFNISHDGQVQKVPFSKMANVYRQSAHLEDKFKELKGQREELNTQSDEFNKYKTFYGKFGHLQEWSENNPQEFETIWNLYQNKDKHLLEHQANLGDETGDTNFKPFVEKISALENKLQELSTSHNQITQAQVDAQEQADVEQVKSDISTFQKEYPEINLEDQDPEGVKLWAKIINFGITQQIPSFRAAALSFLESRLIDTVSARARNEAVEKFKEERRQGVVAKSDQPFSIGGQGTRADTKHKTWDQIGEAAKQQYEALVAQEGS